MGKSFVSESGSLLILFLNRFQSFLNSGIVRGLQLRKNIVMLSQKLCAENISGS